MQENTKLMGSLICAGAIHVALAEQNLLSEREKSNGDPEEIISFPIIDTFFSRPLIIFSYCI